MATKDDLIKLNRDRAIIHELTREIASWDLEGMDAEPLECPECHEELSLTCCDFEEVTS